MRYTHTDADLSPDGVYRYWLHRQWRGSKDPKTALFIMLNPSTADALKDDATIRRCVAFAKDWGMDALEVVNLFAFRSRDPKELAKAADPIGPDNDRWIKDRADRVEVIVCGWGSHGGLNNRDVEVKQLLEEYWLHALHLTRHGQPGHPLYLPSDSKLKRLLK